MVRADGAEILWDSQKKNWIVRIKSGEEVLRRQCKKSAQEMADDALRNLAVQTAHDDGYELTADAVTIKR
jgi:hypothetical protein